MQIQSKIPAFDDISYLLLQINSQTTPAEVHGVLCGLICTGQRLNGKYWLDALFKRFGFSGHLTADRQEVILNIYDVTCRQLIGVEDDFCLLLPEDSHPLSARALSLTEWCQGFLYGLNLIDNFIDEQMVEEVHEAIRCITEIAQLDFEKIEIGEMDEIAYENVLEFVESSVLLIYKQVNGFTTITDISKSLH